ncbi:helix-turn-helix transcriptional regulator [Streptomyces sp. TG1A-60]|uniref:helix-turn-helix domain-containing protein n=1 Tax=Streptomyces sp. TG1A-60 TaxID=3129111 RepID=UPI0030D54E67
MSELIAVEMRRLKESSGLSFAKLAARTHYSRSSWERFLNGKKPVPREAVEQFASAVGAGAGSLLLMEEPGGNHLPRRRRPAATAAREGPPSPGLGEVVRRGGRCGGVGRGRGRVAGGARGCRASGVRALSVRLRCARRLPCRLERRLRRPELAPARIRRVRREGCPRPTASRPTRPY